MCYSVLIIELVYYHIVDCCICSAAILGPTSLRTLEGQKVNTSCDVVDRLTVNDVTCFEVDVMASNGVIHVIDRVLIPDSVKTVGQILDQLGLWTFLEYARDAGMEDILEARRGTEQLTIFAPNDMAFASMSVRSVVYTLQGRRNVKKERKGYFNLVVVCSFNGKKWLSYRNSFTNRDESEILNVINENKMSKSKCQKLIIKCYW